MGSVAGDRTASAFESPEQPLQRTAPKMRRVTAYSGCDLLIITPDYADRRRPGAAPERRLPSLSPA